MSNASFEERIYNAVKPPEDPDTSKNPSATNFGGLTLDANLEDFLREHPKVGCSHFAWNFYGVLWYADGRFYEAICVHKVQVEVLQHESLVAVLMKANERYDSE